jgi:heme-degrading monooxygenase HmoA
MYVIMGVHHPKPGMEKALLETLEKFGNAERGHKGLISAFVWKDETTGVLLGTTLWDTKEDYDAARPDMDKALQGADWRSLDASMEIYRGSPVVWT